MPYDKPTTETVIRHLVHGGFHAPADIAMILIEETFDPEQLTADDRSELFRAVSSAFVAKLQAERSWPAQTDWDRLDEAFDTLTDEHDILTLHASGTTQNDMWDDTLELADAMKREGFPMHGACFYHYQDVGNAVDGHGLHFTFGPIGADSPLEPIVVGQRIVEALKAHGFSPTWDGSEQQRIHIAFDWKKRFDPNEHDDDEEDEDDAE